MNQQVAALENRLRNDPFIERTAREQWTKMCRSIPLGGGKTGLPELWLEMRPMRAAAAQPQIDAKDVTLTVGVQAETRIVTAATKPACPFPAQLELVPPMDNGKLAVGLPIDLPFTELNKLLEAQLKGKHFPEDNNAPVDVEVLGANLAAAGDRLLISLKVKAHERKSWFGFGAQATDPDLGQAGARRQDADPAPHRLVAGGGIRRRPSACSAPPRAPPCPTCKRRWPTRRMIDLKPFAADAKAKITAALADFQKSGSPGVRSTPRSTTCG